MTSTPPEIKELIHGNIPKERLKEIVLDRDFDEIGRGVVFENPNADAEFCQVVAEELYQRNCSVFDREDDWVIAQLATSPHINSVDLSKLFTLKTFRLPYFLADNSEASEETISSAITALLKIWVKAETDAAKIPTQEKIVALLLHGNANRDAFLTVMESGVFAIRTSGNLIKPLSVEDLAKKVIRNNNYPDELVLQVLHFVNVFNERMSDKAKHGLYESAASRPGMESGTLEQLYTQIESSKNLHDVLPVVVGQLQKTDKFLGWPAEWIHEQIMKKV